MTDKYASTPSSAPEGSVIKILWQSYTKTGSQYLDVVQQTLQSLVGPGSQVDVAGLEPADGYYNRLSELRCATQVIARNADAADRGYDAVVIGHFQDGGVPELRSVLDIPVVGLGESAMHHAMQLGERFGLVTIHPGFMALHRQQVRAYGIETKFAGVRAMGTDAETYHGAFSGALDQVDRVADEFRRCAMELVDAGAEVIIPAGGFPALLLWYFDRVPEIGGAAVLDPIGVAVGQAELWARLGRKRVSPARHGMFTRPEADSVTEFVASQSQANSSHPANPDGRFGVVI